MEGGVASVLPTDVLSSATNPSSVVEIMDVLHLSSPNMSGVARSWDRLEASSTSFPLQRRSETGKFLPVLSSQGKLGSAPVDDSRQAPVADRETRDGWSGADGAQHTSGR